MNQYRSIQSIQVSLIVPTSDINVRRQGVEQSARLRLILSTHFENTGCAASLKPPDRAVRSVGVYRVLCEDQ